jgi:hypothetical protein
MAIGTAPRPEHAVNAKSTAAKSHLAIVTRIIEPAVMKVNTANGFAGGRRIVAFYEGSGADDRGRSLEDVLRFEDGALEYTHDFIQWLFPLRERSGANPSAPVLDDAAVAAFHARPELRSALRRAYGRMLAFYKADLTWLTPGNHNHLRLTRMLVSLRTLGLDFEARELYEWITGLAGRHGGVTETTLRYWYDAMTASVY